MDSGFCILHMPLMAHRSHPCCTPRHARRVLGTARAVADPVQPTPEDQKTIDDINEIFGGWNDSLW